MQSTFWKEYRQIVGAQLERVRVAFVDGLTSQNVVLEYLPESSKSGNGWKMTGEFIPNNMRKQIKMI